MAAPSSYYVYDGQDSILLVKWKIKSGNQLLPRTVILTYRSPIEKKPEEGDEKNVLKLESKVAGKVLELLVKEGDIVHPGTSLMKIHSCKHEVIIKELCAECGADLRHLSTQNLQEVVASRSFSMVHVVPELKCSLEQAEQLDQADEVRLLNGRKLTLLVDLDQTLIHTTNDNIPPEIKDVYHFQLYGSQSPWYHTRLRPHTHTFLEKISKYYELHICTFGARLYAHKIASILDPNRALFSHRILSRDECFDPTSKTGNLKSLFPRGDSMVCIIDDREDVWNFAPNVIHVKPYIFFNTTGDINAHHLAACSFQLQKNSDDSSQSVSSTTSEPASTADDSLISNESADAESQNLVPETVEDVSSGIECPTTECEEIPADDGVEVVKEMKHKREYYDDDDDYLLYLEEILLRIHGAYFDLYDEMSSQGTITQAQVPDLKNVIPYVRRKVLRGVNLVFSGVIPTNLAPEKSSLWSLAKSLGAEVYHDVVYNVGNSNTTHVVASKAGTAKLSRAKKLGNIHIVTPLWLMCCATRWERVDERLFPLKKGCSLNSPVFLSPLLRNNSSRDKPKSCARRNKTKSKKSEMPLPNTENGQTEDIEKCGDLKALDTMLDFSSEELNSMGKEVDEACTSSDDELGESVEGSGDKVARGVKRKHSQDEFLCNNVTENDGQPSLGVAKEKSSNDSYSSEKDKINGDSSAEKGMSSDSDSDSDSIVLSDEEALVAQMERELFGDHSSS